MGRISRPAASSMAAAASPRPTATGRGKFLIRAKVSTENLTKEKQAIIVSEIPYQVNKMKLIERIAELYHEKVIDDITDVRDESDRDGMRIVIELRRGAERRSCSTSSTSTPRCRKASR
jgi:DNA gyrase/topoisomerase IV subunit A